MGWCSIQRCLEARSDRDSSERVGYGGESSTTWTEVLGRLGSYCERRPAGRGSICGEARGRGEEEQTELWSETMEGGSLREVVLETSEKAGDVKGVSMGRLMEGRV